MTSAEQLWVKFFTDAGLPSGISATYALTFTENRIQSNMLMDLNKEYLREMGISRMGDVIAILRHAKKVHDTEAQDRILNITKEKTAIIAPPRKHNLKQNKPASPTVRILEHYTRNNESLNNVGQTESKVISLKRKIITSADSSNEVVSHGPAMKRTRQFMDIDEDESHSIPIKRKLIAPQPTNVFSRLGSNNDDRATKSETIITGLKQNVKLANTKNVFNRLGGKNDDINSNNGALRYEGILKNTPTPKKIIIERNFNTSAKRVSRPGGTMRADETPTSIKDKLPITLQHRKSVKFSPHIDYKEIEKRPITNVLKETFPKINLRTVAISKALQKNVMQRLSIAKKKAILKSNIKNRLGKSIKNKSGVFGRLGVTSNN